MSPASRPWWKDGTCYQIWPASYKDSDGDGLGDIPGIISTLDYVKDLGVDIIWLSPMYASPQKDMGYDISDYEAIYPPYGTMDNMDKLIQDTHARGMKLILDLVINHTSDQHAWFKESRKGKDNDKSDWYIWKDPKYVDGKRQPPTNWRAFFGGSAWEYVPERDQYYLHLFEIEQPDLNWEEAVTRKAIYKSAIEFWLKKGIDGFRVDTVNLYSKDTSYPDAEITDPNSEFQIPIKEVVDGPRMHEWLKEMRKDVLDKYGEVMMVGELGLLPPDKVLKYISAKERELSMVFDFDMCMVGIDFVNREVVEYPLTDIKKAFTPQQKFVSDTDAWNTCFAENHDQPRSISRFTTKETKYHEKAGKLMAMLLGTLSGTLFLYQGQEIGMVNIPRDWIPQELKDIASIKLLKEREEQFPGDKEVRERSEAYIQKMGRDNARTPVQWDSSANAGFTTGKPWMRVHDNYPEINVEAQVKDENSLLSFWKRMNKVRKERSELMVYGRFEVLDYDNLDTFMYVKHGESEAKVLVILNFTAEEQAFAVPSEFEKQKRQLLLTNVEKPGKKLSAWEGRVYLLH